MPEANRKNVYRRRVVRNVFENRFRSDVLRDTSGENRFRKSTVLFYVWGAFFFTLWTSGGDASENPFRLGVLRDAPGVKNMCSLVRGDSPNGRTALQDGQPDNAPETSPPLTFARPTMLPTSEPSLIQTPTLDPLAPANNSHRFSHLRSIPTNTLYLPSSHFPHATTC